MAQLRELVTRYGKLAVGVHLCNSAVFLSSSCAAVHWGVDVPALASSLSLPLSPETLDSLGQGESALAAEAVVGYAIYKAAAPVRWPLTAGVTATVARLRKK